MPAPSTRFSLTAGHNLLEKHAQGSRRKRTLQAVTDVVIKLRSFPKLRACQLRFLRNEKNCDKHRKIQLLLRRLNQKTKEQVSWMNWLVWIKTVSHHWLCCTYHNDRNHTRVFLTGKDVYTYVNMISTRSAGTREILMQREFGSYK